MSNKLIKEKTPEKETSIKAKYGIVLLGCGIAFFVMMIIMWQFPTNLDGNPLKLLFTAGFVMLGLVLCVTGVYWMVKKPKMKVGKIMAKKFARDLKIEDDEIIDMMKDFEV